MSQNTNQPSRFKTCSVCGEHFDTEDLDQIFHHSAAPHEPLISGADGALAQSRQDS